METKKVKPYPVAGYDTSDVVSESLRQLSQHVDFDADEEPELPIAYLKKMVFGINANLVRHHRAAKRSTEKQVAVHDQLASDWTDPQDRVAQSEEFAKLHAEIDQLSEIEQFVIVKLFFENKSFRTAAEELNVTVSVLKRIYKDASIKLKRGWSH